MPEFPRACHSFWLQRFEVFETSAHYVFRDRLLGNDRHVQTDKFIGLDQRARDIAFFQHGFMSPRLPQVSGEIGDRPRGPDDLLFWQFPCRTEGAADATHAALTDVSFDGKALHCYLGLPWATWIDKKRNDEAQSQAVRVRLSGLRHALRQLGVNLRVHTVCQHVYWHQLVPLWSALGVTDVWVSHARAPAEVAPARYPFTVHPWALYAVNVEDKDRRAGLCIGKDPATKRYLASFVGVHLDHFVSDARARLEQLTTAPGFLVRVRRDKWHFEDIVYGHQIGNLPLQVDPAHNEAVLRYNEILSDSKFALCPSGAGPNSLRLWEALAVGAVPVLLGAWPEMPRGGSLPHIDWDQIVLRVTDADLLALPTILARISLDEIRLRQGRGMAAYAQVRQQRCFS